MSGHKTGNRWDMNKFYKKLTFGISLSTLGSLAAGFLKAFQWPARLIYCLEPATLEMRGRTERGVRYTLLPRLTSFLQFMPLNVKNV